MKINKRQGFSIVEVVMAIGVMAVVMLGILSLVFQNIRVQRINKNFVVASMLAQEGLELVRNERDWNWLTMDDNSPFDREVWYFEIYDPADSTYTIDSRNGITIINPTVDDITEADAELKQDANGFYVHGCSGGCPTDTPYSRIITVESIPTPGEVDPTGLRVNSHVQWDVQGKIYDYSAETYLYHWR